MTELAANPMNRQETFMKNLRLLPVPLKRQMQSIDSDDIWKVVDIVSSTTGYPICKVRKDGVPVHLNSIDPLTQAQRWSERLSLNKIRTLFIYGCGFGYPLLEVFKNLHQDNVIAVFERNIHIFAAMLHYFDLEPMIKTGRFVFFVGDFDDFSESFQKLISTLDLAFFTAPSIVFAPNSRIYKSEYLKIQEQVFERLRLQLFKIGNDHQDSLLGFHNMVENSETVLKNPYFSSLQDQFKNIPAFIIANGPSLDKQLPELKKIAGKGLILCCESAIVPLMKNGVVPDAICVLERNSRDYVFYFEQAEYPRNMALLAFSGADPRIFSSFAGPKIPVFRQEHSSQFVNRLIGDGSGLYGGTSVAHFAYEAAVFMGANPIVLVGQDLAYDTDGTTHSRQSIYSEERLKDIVEKLKSEPVIFVESNDGKQIATNKIWYEFKMIFEQMIAQTSQAAVINTTESGAKIQGTVCMKLADAIEQYCRNRPPFSLDALIRDNKANLDWTARKNKLRDLQAELKKYIAVYRALGKQAAQSMARCERWISLSEQADFSAVRQQLREVYENNFKEIFQFMSPHLHPQYFQTFFLYGCYRMNELGSLKTSFDMIAAIQIQYEVFDHFNSVCRSLASNLQIDCDKIVSMEFALE
ncbi:motility associated factor glycosyltransferase family protein [Ferviditalea candida]|uniref:6-hydroxymethylpterin diphosphokinase MptE-like protein n=1 Tax=Ferviditalea candida TaxID=3108399 RepID=A0ABU5ZJ31_9BACL|nr:6-hydroxymethylpterin diphosphokinase MptE-like protein [Paenibacillaceae bacterium T2]